MHTLIKTFVFPWGVTKSLLVKGYCQRTEATSLFIGREKSSLFKLVGEILILKDRDTLKVKQRQLPQI
jgi:hypothetical protein